MEIRVLFFGQLKDIAGARNESVSLPEGATLGDLLCSLEKQMPGLNGYLPSIAMSVNQEYARPECVLKPGDEVGLLPPVSGGADTVVEQFTKGNARIVSDKIDTKALADSLQRPEDGAIVVFEGIVRNHSRGRRTLYLDYEAYPEMAVKQIQALAESALAKFEVRDLAVVHRIGRLQIGETSVAIVVASAHRAAAFEACRWLIDTLKRTVPIWKKEYFEDGAVWADGEPFPVEIARGAGSTPPKPASK